MTYTLRPLAHRAFSSLARLALPLLGALLSACGDAPEVETERGVSVPGQAGATDESGAGRELAAGDLDVADAQVPSNAERTEPVSDAMLIDPASEVTRPQELGADADRSAEVCAPSVFPTTENVPQVVERIVTETVEVPVEVEVTPTVLLLLDRSLSMREAIDGGEETRWQAMERLLVGGEQPLLQGLDEHVQLGMTHFSAALERGREQQSGECVELTVDVADIDFRTGAFETLRDQQARAELLGGTPTGEALALVSTSFRDLDTRGEKHIVVVTDGEPTHCSDLFAFSSEAAIAAVMDAARDAREMGITVHVIGIGPDVRAAHLEAVADAGGGLYRSAENSESMQRAFEDVLREVDVVMVEQTVERVVEDTVMQEQRSCVFSLEFGEHGAEAFERGGEVRLAGEPLPFDGADGWTIDGDALVLLGAACDAYLLADEAPLLDLELACPNQWLGVAR